MFPVHLLQLKAKVTDIFEDYFVNSPYTGSIAESGSWTQVYTIQNTVNLAAFIHRQGRNKLVIPVHFFCEWRGRGRRVAGGEGWGGEWGRGYLPHGQIYYAFFENCLIIEVLNFMNTPPENIC